jgi:hypothetical protein
MQADEHRGLATLIKRSLGDPMHYRTSTNKLLLPTAASALGVRMPASATVSNLREAESFAARHGYPIVLKLAYGFGGDAVATCGDRQALDCALPALRESPFADLGASSDTLLAQAYIAGHITYYFIAAWEGQLLAGYATDRVLANPEPKGPASVIRYHRDPVIRDFAVKLVRGFAMNGLAGLECVVDDRTGEAYVIEINRRVTPFANASRSRRRRDRHPLQLSAGVVARPEQRVATQISCGRSLGRAPTDSRHVGDALCALTRSSSVSEARTFDNVESRSHVDDPQHLQPRCDKERTVLGLGALAAAGRDQHRQVGQCCGPRRT